MTNEETVEANADSVLKRIHSLCPCRKTQIETLAGLFGEDDEIAFPSIFVHGHTGTGKSHAMRNMMSCLKHHHVIINCIEFYSAKLMFEAIIDSLDEANDIQTQNKKRCDNFNDFLRCLKQILCDSETPFFIILEKAERLRTMESNLLPAFLRLSELSRLNISVILVTEITLEKFMSGTQFPIPVQVHFSDYSQNELIEIMSQDCPDGHTRDFYATYCRLVVSVFYLACRDLNELRHLASVNFAQYCEPLREDPKTDVRKLWRNIEPYLRKCLSTVYLREVTTLRREEGRQKELAGPAKSKIALELPYLSKYLVIAAYLASHNPSRTDRRFFCKRTYGKMSKRAKTSIKSYSADGKLTGPKAFPLDRLMAMFFSMVEVEIDPNANLLMQVSSLVSLNLLAKVSADDQIDSAKYKCLVSQDFVQSLADNLELNLAEYLFDS
eukprot:Seg1289.8 transcript_id=Seg1289.8/GoldUCD/mRNA.D3Y31 product="Origin recognition complex subunit 5" protein_id=Seg1289.8/GoldUCD/D3Y31